MTTAITETNLAVEAAGLKARTVNPENDGTPVTLATPDDSGVAVATARLR